MICHTVINVLLYNNVLWWCCWCCTLVASAQCQIPQSYMCDGDNDCGNFADELEMCKWFIWLIFKWIFSSFNRVKQENQPSQTQRDFLRFCDKAYTLKGQKLHNTHVSTKQDKKREQGIQLHVSHTLIDHHICHGVRPLGSHVKNGSFSSSGMNWALLRCSTVST